MKLGELIKQAKEWQKENPDVDIMDFDINFMHLTEGEEYEIHVKSLKIYNRFKEIDLSNV